jgi:glutathione peroxidase
MATSVYEIPVTTMAGKPTTLGDYKGKVALVVNVASKCGLTPQYEGLESLYKAYREKGLVVLGFPANDFAGQEPGTNAEIQSFCTMNFGVDFPMFEKIAVTGEGKHPLYKALTEAQPKATAEKPGEFREKLKGFGMTPTVEPEVLWNFEKFLLSKDGVVVARFSPETTPDNPLMTKAIEAELAK